jgi:hypothetical protein
MKLFLVAFLTSIVVIIAVFFLNFASFNGKMDGNDKKLEKNGKNNRV